MSCLPAVYSPSKRDGGPVYIMSSGPRDSKKQRSGMPARLNGLIGLRLKTMLVSMTTASISDLKTHLSRYLREVGAAVRFRSWTEAGRLPGWCLPQQRMSAASGIA